MEGGGAVGFLPPHLARKRLAQQGGDRRKTYLLSGLRQSGLA